jgi:hypothetical protein
MEQIYRVEAELQVSQQEPLPESQQETQVETQQDFYSESQQETQQVPCMLPVVTQVYVLGNEGECMVKRGITSPPCSSKALVAWYEHYMYGLCGEAVAGRTMRFTVILDDVDLAFPSGESSFWNKWIPIVQEVVDSYPRIGSPYRKKFHVRHLDRVQGGFEFVCRDKYLWKEWVFPEMEIGQRPDKVEIRVYRYERIGTATLVTFVARENCPLVFMMGLLQCCYCRRIKVVDVENMPDADDPIWRKHSLFDPNLSNLYDF